MKTITYFFVIFGSLNLSIAQNIFRVNNDPTVPTSPTLWRTIQAAHDAAATNDIVYVEPSYNNTSYGTLVATKKLTIIGNGYNHADNPGATQNWDLRPSILSAVTIADVNAAGTVLQGLSFGSNSVTIKVPNVTINRCKGITVYIIREAGKDPSGAVITQNFDINLSVNGFSTLSGSCYSDFPVQNLVLKNNIQLVFSSNNINYGCSPNTTTVNGSDNVTIANNVINNSFGISNCRNCSVYNNIFRNPPAAGILSNCNSTVASNNVCATNNCEQGSSNVDLLNEAAIFSVANPSIKDKDFQLAGGSPAIGVGIGGVDAGAFGTTARYVLSGLPPVPQITAYSANTSAGVYTTNTPMSITISVRGNN